MCAAAQHSPSSGGPRDYPPAAILVERDEQLIGHLTPHSLRRTFASTLAELGVGPRRAMYLLGHTDAKFTMSVNQQVLDMGRTGSRPWRRSSAGLPTSTSRCSLDARSRSVWTLKRQP